MNNNGSGIEIPPPLFPLKLSTSSSANSNTNIVGPNEPNQTLKLEDIDPLETARQLTLIEHVNNHPFNQTTKRSKQISAITKKQNKTKKKKRKERRDRERL